MYWQKHMVRTRMLRALIIFSLALLVSSGNLLCHEPDQIDHYLDAIDSEDFVGTLIGDAGGDPIGVEYQATRYPEFQYLEKHSAEVVPRMVGRLQTPNGIRYFPTRLVYFILFKRANDTRALVSLADYLDSLPASEERKAQPIQLQGFNEFIYALLAVRTICGPSVFQGLTSPAQVFQARHTIAQRLRLLARQQPTGK